MATDKQPEEVTLGLVYDGLEDSPILLGNHFIIQYQQEEFILTICQTQPPLLLGTPEQQAEQARQMKNIHSKVLVRVGLTEARMEELATVLRTQLETFRSQRMRGTSDVH